MAKQAQKWPFCEQGYIPNDLQHGRSMTVGRSWRYLGEKADFKPFLNVPIKELEQRLKNSQAEEKKVFEAVKKAAEAWDEHGAQTLLLQMAVEYLKTPEVKHTNNEWKKQKDGSWEISNLVYKMTFSIVKVGGEWKLSWEIRYTAPGQYQERQYSYYDNGPKKRIDHEGSKKYKTLDGAQRYMQMKFDQYASYFTSVSPPIPKDVKGMFSVNGQLLQGYTIARPVVKEKEVSVADLLKCLGDEDITPKQSAPPPSQPHPLEEAVPITASGKVITRRTEKPKSEPKAKPQAKHPVKKKPLHKKKSAPTR